MSAELSLLGAGGLKTMIIPQVHDINPPAVQLVSLPRVPKLLFAVQPEVKLRL
jgi:hypothetical protein